MKREGVCGRGEEEEEEEEAEEGIDWKRVRKMNRDEKAVLSGSSRERKMKVGEG